MIHASLSLAKEITEKLEDSFITQTPGTCHEVNTVSYPVPALPGHAFLRVSCQCKTGHIGLVNVTEAMSISHGIYDEELDTHIVASIATTYLASMRASADKQIQELVTIAANPIAYATRHGAYVYLWNKLKRDKSLFFERVAAMKHAEYSIGWRYADLGIDMLRKEAIAHGFTADEFDNNMRRLIKAIQAADQLA